MWRLLQSCWAEHFHMYGDSFDGVKSKLQKEVAYVTGDNFIASVIFLIFLYVLFCSCSLCFLIELGLDYIFPLNLFYFIVLMY